MIGNPLGHQHANFWTWEVIWSKVRGVGVPRTPPRHVCTLREPAITRVKPPLHIIVEHSLMYLSHVFTIYPWITHVSYSDLVSKGVFLHENIW